MYPIPLSKTGQFTLFAAGVAGFLVLGFGGSLAAQIASQGNLPNPFAP